MISLFDDMVHDITHHHMIFFFVIVTNGIAKIEKHNYCAIALKIEKDDCCILLH